MNFRDLKYFMTLAEVKNFKQASDNCFVTQPTLSMQIKKLEEELGVQLFERDKRSVNITPKGEQLLDYAKQILQLQQDMTQFAQTLQDPLSGTLEVGIFPTLSPYLLPKIINQLPKKFPNLSISLHETVTENCLQQLLNGKLDIIITASDIHNDKLEQLNLFTETFELACHHQHPLTQYQAVPHQKIPENELLLLGEGHCLRDQGLEYCQRINKQHDTRFSATSLSTLIAMVALEKGITLIPRLAATTLRHPGIKVIPFKSNPPHRTISLCWRKSMKRDPLFTQLASTITQALKKIDGIHII